MASPFFRISRELRNPRYTPHFRQDILNAHRNGGTGENHGDFQLAEY